MSNKIIIFQLSLAMDNNPIRSVNAFANAGINKWLMIWHWMPKGKFLERLLGKSISTLSDEYRTGNLTTSEFRNAVRAKFPNVALNDERFDAAWNAMCVVGDKTKEAFRELSELVTKEGNTVYLVANTNELHDQHTKKEYGAELPGIPYFSFEKKKFGDALLNQLHFEISLSGKTASNDIGLFYMPAPQRNLGWFSWLRNYFPRFFQSNAENRVAQLQRNAEGKFTLIEFTPNVNGTGIYDALTSRGWLEDTRKFGPESTSAFTPARRNMASYASSSNASTHELGALPSPSDVVFAKMKKNN